MSSVLIPLAQGCEELEAITIMDLMVRAGIEVTTAGLDDAVVTAARGTKIIPDTSIDKVSNQLYNMIILPGGLPGSDYLRDNQTIQNILKAHHENGQYVAAICAAPKALAKAGLLNSRTATAYPGTLEALNLNSTIISTENIVIDDHIITSRSPGTAMEFALALIELLEGKTRKEEVEKGLCR